jgi:hypothetical protein
MTIEAAAAMAGYLSTALQRARSWAFDHADRADRRGLVASEDVFMNLGNAFELLAASAISHGVRPSLSWCASRAFNVGCIVTEMERGGGYAEAHRHQVLECNASEIRSLLWVVSNIADFHFRMAEGSLSAHEAQIAAAEALIAAPSLPPTEEQDEQPR